MKVLSLVLKVILLVILGLGLAQADSIQLRNGRHLQGRYIGGTSTSIGFMAGTNVEYFSTADVLVLIFESGNDSTMRDLQPNPMKGKPARNSRTHLVRAAVETNAPSNTGNHVAAAHNSTR
jgi:hypothetical protein